MKTRYRDTQDQLKKVDMVFTEGCVVVEDV